MIEKQKNKKQEDLSLLSKPYWSKRMKLLCKRNGGASFLCDKYSHIVVEEGNSRLLKIRIDNVIYENSSISTAADLVTKLENAIANDE